MAKKWIVDRKYNLGIVESYKPVPRNEVDNSPILGTFMVKGMTVENMQNQNGRVYESAVWQQPTSFGRGGKFINENGQLKPSTLFGSLDHPIDDRAEYLLQEGAIAWQEVTRNEDGTWDGKADILKTPQGWIVKTYLDYAKLRGGGELLGVSSRALGEATIKESNGQQLEYIIPESFDLQTFDFVYNPSFVTATATLLESTKKRNVLVESIKNLAKQDIEHKAIYEETAKEIEEAIATVNASQGETNMETNTTTEVTTNENIDKVEAAEQVETKPEQEVQPINEKKDDEEEQKDEESKDSEDEDSEDEEEKEEEPKEEEPKEEEPKEEEPKEEEKPEKVTLESLMELVTKLQQQMEEMLQYLAPVSEPESETHFEDEQQHDQQEENDSNDEFDSLEDEIEITDEELANMDEEELEYLRKIAGEK